MTKESVYQVRCRKGQVFPAAPTENECWCSGKSEHLTRWDCKFIRIDNQDNFVLPTKGEVSMRILKNGENRFTEVVALNDPEPDGTYRRYCIGAVGTAEENVTPCEFAQFTFQNGPVPEAGVNGCFIEDLIAVCIDRLEAYQAGKFECRENKLAIEKLEAALYWLDSRTKNRRRRGVEGTDQV